MKKMTDPDEINRALSRAMQTAAAEFFAETGTPALLVIMAHDGTRLYVSANEAAMEDSGRIKRMCERLIQQIDKMGKH